jgi:putative selenium metabolism protein SsnA
MIITNGKIITWDQPNQILDNQAILIREGKILKIGDESKLLEDYPLEEKMDANGQFVMPGLICAHTHFYGAYSRGLAIPTDPPPAFPEILRDLWWSLDKALDEKAVRSSAWVSIIDAIKHGNTTLFDHHASPNFIIGSLDAIADVIDESGIRASLAYEVTDRDGIEKAEAGIEENVRFLERIKSGGNLNSRLTSSFGLHASLTLSQETLSKVRTALDDQFGIHIHVAEHTVDQYDSIKKSGKRVVDRLCDFNLLNKNAIVAHAVHVDAKETCLLADTQTWVTHQPRSNMNNAVGIGDVESMKRAGVKVCLGNDGFSNTMWDEWKTAYLVHKLVNRDPRRMGGYEVVDMAIYNNAEMASHFFGIPVGKIIEGAVADLIFVDYKPFTELTSGNLPWHILFGMQHSMVTMTMVSGKVLMSNRQLIGIDEEKIFNEALENSKSVWENYNSQF